MNFNLCPVCMHVNPASANFCNACGAALVLPCPHCTAANRPSARTCHECGGALQAGEASANEAAMAPADAAEPAADPGGLTLTLRPFEELAAAAEAAEGAASPDIVSTTPTLPELVVSDPEWAAPNGAAQPAPETPHRRSKAEHRAAVRRARLGERPAAAAELLRDVLVLDRDNAGREQLSHLLEGFGFEACPVRSIFEADDMIDTKPFAAVFLDIVLGDAYASPEAELCRKVRLAKPPDQARGPALIIVSDHARSVDRVRATLAGVDGFLVKPLSRGDVARALDECGVALPSDSRRA